MMSRDEIVKRALRAAAAVTGRASKWGCAAVAGTVMLVGCTDQVTETEAERLQPVSATSTDATSADATSVDTTSTQITNTNTAGADATQSADGTSLADSDHTPNDTFGDVPSDTHGDAPSDALDVAAARCDYIAEGVFDWRCCTDPSSDGWVVWVAERPGCSFCFDGMDPNADWDTSWACCTEIFEVQNTTCAAETDTTAQSDCYNANSAMYDAFPRCTPWGPPAPPRWSGVSLAALLREQTERVAA